MAAEAPPPFLSARTRGPGREIADVESEDISKVCSSSSSSSSNLIEKMTGFFFPKRAPIWTKSKMESRDDLRGVHMLYAKAPDM